VTSQFYPSKEICGLNFPNFSPECAKEILTHDLIKERLPTEKEICIFLSYCGNNPLVLSLLRTGVSENDFNFNEIMTDLNGISGLEVKISNSYLVIDNILNKYNDKFATHS
jgi:hypothetical protein